MFMWIIGIGGTIGTSDREFDRASPVEDLLK
jgi:hypothetical protein